MKKYWLIIAFLFVSSGLISLRAQPTTCGTILDDTQIAFEAGITDSLSELKPIKHTLNITLHIVNDENGNRGIDMSVINQAVSELNIGFEKVELQFRIDNINDIANYHFNDLQRGDQEQDLLVQYYSVNTINLYLVSALHNESNNDICAFTYYPSANIDAVFIDKDCLNGRQLVRQIGHFLNLYHTHETQFGNELVDKSNCTTAGDLVCDTPADPELSGLVANCKYLGSLTDSNGDYFVPTTHNFMSFTTDDCDCYYFTDQQLLRMLNCLVLFKNNLW